MTHRDALFALPAGTGSERCRPSHSCTDELVRNLLRRHGSPASWLLRTLAQAEAQPILCRSELAREKTAVDGAGVWI